MASRVQYIPKTGKNAGKPILATPAQIKSWENAKGRPVTPAGMFWKSNFNQAVMAQRDYKAQRPDEYKLYEKGKYAGVKYRKLPTAAQKERAKERARELRLAKKEEAQKVYTSEGIWYR